MRHEHGCPTLLWPSQGDLLKVSNKILDRYFAVDSPDGIPSFVFCLPLPCGCDLRDLVCGRIVGICECLRWQHHHQEEQQEPPHFLKKQLH